ncbi:MAG: toll/interleukin-1 receptor domain-containing protein [Lachnospiraceae bacterium]|nr:toll/interleukin-1 receptor domain-containing protein [Lachnospiraceae bacterium]
MREMSMGMHDVFISYSTKNKNVADAVVADFEQHGIKCWYAPRDILPGEEWVTAITKALEVSKALVLIFTDESNNSRQVMNEIAVAFNAGITIVPFRLTDEQMSSELEYYLTRVHWLDAVSKPLKKNITALREYIEVIVNTENGAAPEKPLTEEQNEAVKKAKKREKILSCLFLAGVLCVVLGFVIDGVIISRKNAKAKEFRNAVEMYYGQAGASDEETLKSVLEDVSDDYPDKYYYLGMLEERTYSYEDAFEMYETGIDEGSLLSLLGMGNLYLNGYGVDRDVIEAKEYFDNALFAGCVEANYYEALIWEKGLIPGEEPDHEKALEHLEVLTGLEMPIVNGAVHSEPEIVARTYILQGDIYASGNGGADKTAKSASLSYQNAINSCYRVEGEALCHLGDMYLNTGDAERAYNYYQSALAADGNRQALKALGDMYYDGIYVDMDEDTAIEYYLDASDYSFDGSGLAFYDGYRGGVLDKDMLNRIGLYYYYAGEFENSAFFFTECAERFEYLNAMSNAALAYENLMDWRNAFLWYTRAIEAGHEDSDKFRKKIRIMVDDGLIDEEDAKYWM